MKDSRYLIHVVTSGLVEFYHNSSQNAENSSLGFVQLCMAQIMLLEKWAEFPLLHFLALRAESYSQQLAQLIAKGLEGFGVIGSKPLNLQQKGHILFECPLGVSKMHIMSSNTISIKPQC